MSEILSMLRPPKGAVKRKKRVGCGPGSGHGKTSTRGHKGAKSRSGKEYDSRFEGGQMPLYRRIPKKGFSNYRFKKFYEIVNLKELNKFEENTEITPEFLKEKGLIEGRYPVKILGEGEIKVKLLVKAHKFSRSAREKIEKAGGKVEVLPC